MSIITPLLILNHIPETRVKRCLKPLVILQLYRAGVKPAGGEEDSGGNPEWIPVELEILTKLWLPDTEILRLKGFHRLSVLDRLQVRTEAGRGPQSILQICK